MFYDFQDKYFGIDDKGLHLLRNNLSYRSIRWGEIDSIRLGKGRAIANWVVLLVLGGGMVVGGISYGAFIVDFLTSPAQPGDGNVYIEEIAGVVIFVLVGAYCMFLSLKQEEVLEFRHQRRREAFAMKPFRKSGKLEDMIAFINKYKTVTRV